MKILMVSHEYGNMGTGISSVVDNITKQLKIKGHEVTTLSPLGPEIKLGKDPELYQKQGGRYILNFWGLFSNWAYENDLNKYDIIWLHNPLILDIKFRQQEFAKKVVVSVHSTYNGRWEHLSNAFWPNEIAYNIYHKWMNHKEKQAYKSMSTLKFIVATETLKNELENIGAIDIKVIHYGIDVDKFKVGTHRQLGQFCICSRFESWKRVDLAIQKFNRLPMKSKILKIAGYGKEFNKLKKMSSEKITFLGKISREDCMKLYQESEYFLSMSEYEGMPTALLEALSCGCKPIVSDIPGHREIIQKLGERKTPKDIHQFMVDNYSWSKAVDNYLEALK